MDKMRELIAAIEANIERVNIERELGRHEIGVPVIPLQYIIEELSAAKEAARESLQD